MVGLRKEEKEKEWRFHDFSVYSTERAIGTPNCQSLLLSELLLNDCYVWERQTLTDMKGALMLLCFSTDVEFN